MKRFYKEENSNMNENENRIKPQVPDTETELTDDMLEGASGGTPDYTIDDGNGCCYWCHEPLVKGLRSGVLFCKKCKLYTLRS